MKIQRTNKTKKALISTLIIAGVALVVTPGFSYWVISSQYSYQNSETVYNSDFDVSGEDPYYTVNVYQAFAQAGDIQTETKEVKLSDSVTDWNTFETLIETYDIQIGEGYSEVLNGSETGSGFSSYSNFYTYKAGTYYSAQTVGTDESGNSIYVCTLKITTDVVHTFQYRPIGSNSNSYSGAYTTTINTVPLGETEINETAFGQLSVKKGDIITSKMFSSFFSSMEEDYYFSNFIYSDDQFENLFYLNETPVVEDLNLYVLFYTEEPYSLGLSSLTDKINENTGTLTVSNGEETSYDLNNDIGYISESNTVYVGYYDKPTTVGSGSEVNLCLADGSIYTIIDYDETANIVVDETSKTCDYTVKLGGDLEINGTLTVAADIGSGTNQGLQSQIYSHYVCLDLCGHQINVNNGGELLVYGVIKDSVGNGSVHVYGGGTIQSTIVAYDYKGGSSTIGSFAFDVFPFSAYNLPYLQVPTFLEYDYYGWGALTTFYNLNPFSSSVKELPGVLNLVGQDNGNDSTDAFLIALQPGTYNESYVLINLTTNENVSNDSNKNGNTTNYCLDRHLNFYLYNADCETHHFTISFSMTILYVINIDMDMRSDQFDFPISPMFSLYFYNSDMTLYSRMNFQKGSSLYMDENSNLILDFGKTTREYIYNSNIHSETIDTAGSVFFFDVATDTYTNLNGYESMETYDRHNYNSISSIESYLNDNTAFYKYASSSNKVAGSILFRDGNTASIPYSIGGYLDCSSVGTINSEGNIGNVYNFHTTDANNYNPFLNLISEFETNESTKCYFKTYDFDGVNGQFYTATAGYSASYCCDYMVLQRGRSLPLISNGVAYAYNNVYGDQDDLYSPNLVGTYNSTSNLIESDGCSYYFNTDDEQPYIKQGTISINNRNYIYNHNTKIVQCNYDNTNHLITDVDNSSSYHVFFSGGYFPYNESGGTSYVTLTRLLSKYNASSSPSDITSPLAITYNATYGYWRRSS